MEQGCNGGWEVVLPEGEKNAAKISKLETRIDRALLQFDRESEVFRDAGIRMDTIAIAVALEYTDFRYTTEWRQRCTGLAIWLEVFARRHSMIQTRPAESMTQSRPNDAK
jgi:glutathione S-transferase